jgi:hypothetical protein
MNRVLYLFSPVCARSVTPWQIPSSSFGLQLPSPPQRHHRMHRSQQNQR